MDFRKLINAVSLLEAAEIKATRRIQDNGSLTNFNIDRDDPSKLFTGLRTGGEDYTPDDIVKVYYKDDARLETFLGTNVGRRAQEVDEDGNPVEAPQTDDELDADSADSGAGDSAAAQNAAPQTDDELDADSADNAGIRLSDGTSFDPNDEQNRNEAAQKLDELIRKYNDLIGRMSESAPVSIRGYLKEYGLLEAFIAEELSPEETEELRNVIADINQLADSGILSEPNTAAARQAIADAPDLPRAAAPTVDSDEETADDADSADSGTPDAPPEADEVSADSGDQDARVDPGEGSTSSSLEAFASSGKGGLANDADETAAIEELQQFLTDMGVDPNGVDGKYGMGTINAVKEFQGIFGTTQDGDAGPETIGKIVEYRNDLQEMDDLIAAGSAGSTTANDAAGGGDVESTVDSPVAAESRSWRDLITLVENMFVAEALDDTQRSRAEELIAKYEALVGNLPEPAKAQVQEKIDALKGALEGEGVSGQDPGADTDADAETDDAGNDVNTMDAAQKARAIHEGVDGAGTDEEAVLAVLGSIADSAEFGRVKAAFQQLYNEDMVEWINSEVSFSDQDNVDAIIARLEGGEDGDPGSVEAIRDAADAAEGLYQAMKGGWTFGMGTDEEAILAILGRISPSTWPNVMQIYQTDYDADVLSDLAGELSGTDKDRVNDNIKRFGYEFQDEDPGYREVGAGAEEPEAGAEAGAGNVEPRPTGSGVQGDYARAAWDEQYGETHNPDGTPKAGSGEGDDEAGAETGNQPSSDLDQRIARYEAMPRETTEQITAWMQALKNDEELFNLLSQADQTAINTYLDGIGN